MDFGPNRSFWLRWHWRIGLAAAAFLLITATTGLLLSHARFLGLHNIHIDSDWLTALYNMDGQSVTLEKLLLDVHTGNLIGLPGKLLSDMAGLAIVFLALSGIYNWWKRPS